MRGEQAIFNLEIKKKSGLSINPNIHHSKVFSSELKTFWHTLIFFLNRSFLDIVEKNQNPVFKIGEFLLFLYIHDSDWLNFIHFLEYKYKFRLVSVLRKREDQALIPISTILKFLALICKSLN